MLKSIGLIASFLLLTCSGALGQAAKPAEPVTIAQTLNRGVTGVEDEFVSAADAMPENNYSFAPSNGEFKGVRDFAEQVKHVAAVNYMVGAAILQEKPPVELAGESGPNSVKSKAEILKFLKDSFTYAHKAVASINETNLLSPIKSPFAEGNTTRLGMATLIVGHCFDHYGQIAEYLRMNSIIPPASRN